MSETPVPRRRVRLLGSLLGLAALLIVAELASALALWVLDGKPFSPARLSAERSAAAASTVPGALGAQTADGTPAAGPQPAATPASGPHLGRPDRTPGVYLPHPFFGFTLDPTDPHLRQAVEAGGRDVDQLGLFVDDAPPGFDVTVGVFGGSVSVYACIDGAAALRQELLAVPALKGRSIRLRCGGLGGFKQPQAATELIYLLALGERFDAVVLLDGFNELALSFNQNKHAGIHPFYPWQWGQLLGTQDLEQQRSIGKIVALEGWRAGLARRCQSHALARTATGSLLWRFLDRSLAGRIAAERATLAARPPARRSYREHGPRLDYPDDRARIQGIARFWAESSRSMAALCAGRGIRFFHFLQPSPYDPGSKPLSPEERRLAGALDSPFEFPVHHGYPVLRAEGQRLRDAGVAFTDLSGLFKEVREPLYVDAYCHVNARGNALLGAAIGRTLASRWVTPAAAAPPPAGR